MSTTTMKFFGGTNGHPNYETNVSKSPYSDRTHCCVFCGKHTPKPTFHVFLDAMGVPCDPHSTGDVLGYYPIGTDCKTQAKAFGIAVYALRGGEFTNT